VPRVGQCGCERHESLRSIADLSLDRTPRRDPRARTDAVAALTREGSPCTGRPGRRRGVDAALCCSRSRCCTVWGTRCTAATNRLHRAAVCCIELCFVATNGPALQQGAQPCNRLSCAATECARCAVTVDVLRCATAELFSVATGTLCCNELRCVATVLRYGADAVVQQCFVVALCAVATGDAPLQRTDGQQRWWRRRTNLLSAVATRDMPLQPTSAAALACRSCRGRTNAD
jgi:hypothetical protein